MGKYSYRALTTILVIILLINLILFIRINTSMPQEVYLLDPHMKNANIVAKLYFVAGDHLVTESREVVIDDNSLEYAVIDALNQGPLSNTPGVGLDERIRVEDIAQIDDVIYLNLNSSYLLSNNLNNSNFSLNIMAIVNSITERKPHLKVQFLFDGKKLLNEVYQITLSEPIRRNESIVFTRDKTAAEFLFDYLDLIFQGRNDLAYDFLSLETKNLVNFQEFDEMMTAYVDAHIGYQRYMHFTQSYQGDTLVTVYFDSSNPLDVTKEIVEKWFVVEIAGEMFISLEEQLTPRQ